MAESRSRTRLRRAAIFALALMVALALVPAADINRLSASMSLSKRQPEARCCPREFELLPVLQPSLFQELTGLHELRAGLAVQHPPQRTAAQEGATDLEGADILELDSDTDTEIKLLSPSPKSSSCQRMIWMTGLQVPVLVVDCLV